MSIEDDIALFERVPTLRLLGGEALRILAIGAESRNVHDGEVLFNAGDPADGGYVIQKGSFSIKPSVAANAEELTAEPGMLLGEFALLAETVRPATAIACEPSAVIRIPRSLFLKILENYPAAASKLRDQIAARSRQSVQEIENVRAKLDTGKAPG